MGVEKPPPQKPSFSLKHKTRFVPAGPTLSADGSFRLPPSVGPEDCEVRVWLTLGGVRACRLKNWTKVQLPCGEV